MNAHLLEPYESRSRRMSYLAHYGIHRLLTSKPSGLCESFGAHKVDEAVETFQASVHKSARINISIEMTIVIVDLYTPRQLR